MPIQIHDNANVLSPEDVNSLNHLSESWPFEVHITTTSDFAKKSDFESEISRSVTNPNVLGVGVDPIHRHVTVRFGSGTRVHSSVWSSISSAGNSDFKNHQWAVGIVKIVEKAEASRSHTESQPVPANEPIVHHSHTGWIVAGVLLLAAIGIGVYFWWRNKKREEEHKKKVEELDEEIQEKRSLNQEESEWADKFRDKASRESPVKPYPRAEPGVSSYSSVAQPRPAATTSNTTVVIQQSPTTSVNTGSDGLLTGFMLGSMSSRPPPASRDVYVEREVIREVPSRRGSYVSGDSSSWDDDDDSSSVAGGGGSSEGGGSSSSWDDSSSDDSSDSGGDDSDF